VQRPSEGSSCGWVDRAPRPVSPIGTLLASSHGHCKTSRVTLPHSRHNPQHHADLLHPSFCTAILSPLSTPSFSPPTKPQPCQDNAIVTPRRLSRSRSQIPTSPPPPSRPPRRKVRRCAALDIVLRTSSSPRVLLRTPLTAPRLPLSHHAHRDPNVAVTERRDDDNAARAHQRRHGVTKTVSPLADGKMFIMWSPGRDHDDGRAYLRERRRLTT